MMTNTKTTRPTTRGDVGWGVDDLGWGLHDTDWGFQDFGWGVSGS